MTSARVYCKKGVVIVEPHKRKVRLRHFDTREVLTLEQARELIVKLAWAAGEVEASEDLQCRRT